MPEQPAPRDPTRSTALERLYAMWIVSTVILLLALLAVAAFVRGRLAMHAELLTKHSLLAESFETRLRDFEASLTRMEAAVPEAVDLRPAERPPRPQRAAREAGAPATAPTRAGPPDPAAAGVGQRVRAMLAREGVGWTVTDRDTAGLLLVEAADPQRTDLDGETLAKLALLAELLGRGDSAEAFAQRATAAGVAPREYHEYAARTHLVRAAGPEALVFAQRLLRDEESDPQAGPSLGRLLLGRAQLLLGNVAAADEALAGIAPEALPPTDRVELGRAYVTLERWEELAALLETLASPPPALRAAHNFLHAALFVHRERLTEAVAILEGLLEERPDDAELHVWRAAALVKARQYAAAREALRGTLEIRADQPDAWHWLGMLEMAEGNLDQAGRSFQQALAASRHYAASWEALGTIALNAGDLETAAANFGGAVRANPRRASAHLLLAVTHARAQRREEALASLRRAAALDAGALETARRTPVLREAVGEGALDALEEETGLNDE